MRVRTLFTAGRSINLSAHMMLAFSTLALDISVLRPPESGWARTQCGGPSGTTDMPSRWASQVIPSKPPLHQYPRPSLVRSPSKLLFDRDEGDSNTWSTLNGLWEWQPTESAFPPFGQTLNGSILVPFPIESCLSGVAPTSSSAFVERSVYRLVVLARPSRLGHRLWLRFGAVNWQAAVYLNGALAANHSGGYDGFGVELTSALEGRASLEILVSVYSPADRGAQPNGKARISAISNPGGDTYTPASGIWQSVWLEEVPAAFISRLQIGQNDESGVTATAFVDPPHLASSVLFEAVDPATTHVVASGSAAAGTAVSLTIPSPKLWSPTSPTLYDLRVSCATCEDAVLSYFGLRTFKVGSVGAGRGSLGYTHLTSLLVGPDLATANMTLRQAEERCDADDRCVGFTYPSNDTAAPQGAVTCTLKRAAKLYFNSNEWQTYLRSPLTTARPLLNGQPIFLAGWLDQSYWPDGIYTAPTEEALVFDVEAVVAFGMNTVRLHQKVNPERWYYAADRSGVLVMQDAVQKYGGATNATIPLFEKDLVAMIASRGNHPSIVQWETFNEQDCYGVFDTPPHSVADIVDLARSTDWEGRPVDTDSGGGANYDASGDVNDIHSYPNPGNPLPSGTKYAMLGEFGGIGTFTSGKEWVPNQCYTYLPVNTSQLVADTYVNMTRRMLDEQMPRGLASSIYTQITDVELECDGFFNYDRSPKLSAAQTSAVAEANRKLVEAGSAAWAFVRSEVGGARIRRPAALRGHGGTVL